ncbi:hypothetical protein G9A89_017888 [Geosiphon pyriformis]|nr:hypothetical protein G9A89_017888 [Geosiphon pyriformis]
MDLVSLSAGGPGLVSAGLGFQSSISIKKKAHVKSMYSCSLLFKKMKKPEAFGTVVDLSTGLLSTDMLQTNSGECVKSWSSKMDSEENSVSEVSDIENMKNMVTKEMSYIDSNASEMDNIVDNATLRMMHTRTYILEKLPKELSLDTLSDNSTEKQKLKTTPNTPKTTAKHLQTLEPGTSFKLPLSITLFPASLAQLQTPSLPLIRFLRIEDFQSPKSPIQQQEPILTSTNLIDYLAENRNEETESEQETENSENKEEIVSTYIAKIPEFTREDSKTSSQEWLDKVLKAEDANDWNTARMLKAIPYFLQRTAEQFTDNNTSITLRNQFRNIKQEPSKSVMTYLGKFNKLLRRIRQLETNEYYSNTQILDQFIAGLKDKLIKKVHLHAPENLATAIQQTKNYEMAIEKANHTKLVNLAIGETSLAAEEKIDQLTKKVENYFTNQ